MTSTSKKMLPLTRKLTGFGLQQQALVSRRDVIVVASVSASMALAHPKTIVRWLFVLLQVFLCLAELHGNLLLSNTNEVTLHLREDASAYEAIQLTFGLYDELATRIEFWGDTVQSIAITHPVSGEVAARKDETYLTHQNIL